jgi:hypothetical protein
LIAVSVSRDGTRAYQGALQLLIAALSGTYLK